LAVTTDWVRRDVLRKHKVAIAKISYDNADVAATFNTGFKKVYSWEVSPPSIAGKYCTGSTVAAGVISLTLTDPLAPAYIFVTAYGI